MLEQLDELKSFTATNRYTFHQLVALAAFGRALRSEYEKLQLEEPDWVDIQLKAVVREIRTRNLDHVESRLRDLRIRKDTLKSADEKRADIDAEIDKLQKQRDAVPA